MAESEKLKRQPTLNHSILIQLVRQNTPVILLSVNQGECRVTFGHFGPIVTVLLADVGNMIGW